MGSTINEASVSIFVNGQELVTIMATPCEQEDLAVGYLFTEGLISHRNELVNVSLAPNQSCVDVWLEDKGFTPPRRRIITSGCGKGVTFRHASAQLPPLDSDLRVTHRDLVRMMRELQKSAHLYRRARGIHAAGLANLAGLVVMAEDVGRHNALDKVAGRCLLDGVDPRDHILLTTGRISSDMMVKARRMQVPVIASLTSPTSLSLGRGEQWNMTIVGYLRSARMQVYTHRERLR
jgi:FdhD protein